MDIQEKEIQEDEIRDDDIVFDTEKETVDEFFDRIQQENKDWLAQKPWYYRLYRKVWPLPYKMRLFRRLDDWSWEKFHCPPKLKYFVQRALHGYSSADVWNLHYYLERVLIGSLKELKESKVGIPMVAYNAAGKELYVCGTWPSDSDEVFESRIAIWDKVLGDIIEGLEAAIALDDMYFSNPERKKLQDKKNRALKLLMYNWESFWD
jgi:hypothetical protein